MLVVAMDQLGYRLLKLIQNGIVHMMDVNERALQLAEENAELNGIQNVRYL